MDWAIAVNEIGLVVIGLAGYAVVPRIRTLTDPAVVEDGLHERLHRRDVSGLGRANEIVVADVQQFPHFTKAGARAVGLFERSDAVGFGRTLDLETVFVGAREKEGRVASKAMPPGQGVCRHRRIGVPDMGHVVHVINRSGDVEGLRHTARLRGCDNSDEPQRRTLPQGLRTGHEERVSGLTYRTNWPIRLGDSWDSSTDALQ